jgi:hypothetical protein
LQRGAAWSTAALLSLGAAGLLAYIALRAMGWLGLHYVGDAARYLSPAPHNIAVRKNIRNAVMDLLSKLHEEEPMRYDSIIVVGHSLGSVIAYDALSHFWQRKHSALVDPQPVRQTMLGKVRRLSRLLARDDLDAPARERLLERYRARQAELLAEQRKVGVNWRIGEFVTLGSPLAHAPFMFAANTQEWAALKRERMYPTSPPQAEDDRDSGRLVQRFDFPTQARHGEVSILHHAALFACTRWTNLYFRGDWIGGPLGADALFGAGVRDVPLQPHSPWSRWTPASHVRYWHAGEPHALLELAQALRLGYPQRRSRWRLETDDSSGELRWRRAPAPAS